MWGGGGAARFLRGLLDAIEPSAVTAVVNTGDDTVLHGLSISPDLDTITYTLAGAIDPERGWGLELAMVPMSDERLATVVTVDDPDQPDGPSEVSFQDYFVRLRHSVRVHAVRFDGAATLAPAARAALSVAVVFVISLLNPIVCF